MQEIGSGPMLQKVDGTTGIVEIIDVNTHKSRNDAFQSASLPMIDHPGLFGTIVPKPPSYTAFSVSSSLGVAGTPGSIAQSATATVLYKKMLR